MHEHDGLGKNRRNHERGRTVGTSWRVWVARGGLFRRSAAWMAALAYAWWAVSLPPFSGLATAVVLLSGVGVTVAGQARRDHARRASAEPRTAAWAGLAVVAVAWEVLAYMQHPRADHPTLSSLINALLDSHPARAAAFVLWLMATLELARR